jgi:activator of HSP90 ATPase
MEIRITRRKVSLLAGGIALIPASAQSLKPGGSVIHQEIDFAAPPSRIYEVLLDARQFAAATKDTAEIQPQAGAAFRLFGGRIEGRNIELIPNQRIVQAWRPASWSPGIYSIVRFELMARAAGTQVVLDHTGFPEDKLAGLSDGWPLNYWDPLHKYLKA